MENQARSSTDPKIIAIISYLTLVGWVIALLMNTNPKSALASFHIRQSLGLMLVFAAANVAMMLPIIGWIVAVPVILAAFIAWIIGIVAALNGEMRTIPYLGETFQEWFDGF